MGRFANLERFLLDRSTLDIPIPPFVREAATRIERAHGCVRVAELHKELDAWRASGPDAYTAHVEEISNGKSKELWSMVMHRSSPAR